MGCDIHTYVERRDDAGEWRCVPDMEPFDDRNYSVFGWLAGVRNYSKVQPISAPRGLPGDVSASVRDEREELGSDGHSASWLSLDELRDFDYNAEVEDRRVTIGQNGACTAEPGGGKTVTYREFLGSSYFADLDRLAAVAEGGPVRVVFWFDN